MSRFCCLWIIVAACSGESEVRLAPCRPDLFEPSAPPGALAGSNERVEATIGPSGGVLTLGGATITVEPDRGRVPMRVGLESLRCYPKLDSVYLPSLNARPTRAFSPVYRIGPENLQMPGGVVVRVTSEGGSVTEAWLYTAADRNMRAAGKLGSRMGDSINGHVVDVPAYFFLAGPTVRCSGFDAGCD